MREETRKILQLLENGTVNAAQAEDLMEAMGFFAETPAPQPKRGASRLLINVDSADGDKVRLKVPSAMIKAGMGLAQSVNVSGQPAMKDVDIEAVIRTASEMVESGEIGEIVSVDSAEGDHVVIKME